MKSFADAINEFFIARVDEINQSVVSQEWYKELQDKVIEARKKICGDSDKNINDYEIANSEMEYKTQIEIYKKAFNDGIQAASVITNMTPILTPKQQFELKNVSIRESANYS